MITWNPSEKEEEEYPERANKLIIKQILLGVEAKADEYNVVEVSAMFTLTSKVSYFIPDIYIDLFTLRLRHPPKTTPPSKFRSPS